MPAAVVAEERARVHVVGAIAALAVGDVFGRAAGAADDIAAVVIRCAVVVRLVVVAVIVVRRSRVRAERETRAEADAGANEAAMPMPGPRTRPARTRGPAGLWRHADPRPGDRCAAAEATATDHAGGF